METKTQVDTASISSSASAKSVSFLARCHAIRQRIAPVIKRNGKPYLILLIIHMVGIVAILRADVSYLDDVGRVAKGY